MFSDFRSKNQGKMSSIYRVCILGVWGGWLIVNNDIRY